MESLATRPRGALRDRHEAGVRLAERLLAYRGTDAVVLAIPRGGVPVGLEIARRLGLPLDLLLVRKVGAPTDPEYGLGAVAEGGIRVLDRARARDLGESESSLEPVIARELAEIDRRSRIYRAGRPAIDIGGRTVIVVDDCIATGGTVRAAVLALRAKGARRIVLALGVSPASTARSLAKEVDELVAVLTPEVFYAVGEWYLSFPPVEDEEVLALLRAPSERGADGAR